MTDPQIATIEEKKLKTKALHDLILAVPVKDGSCRFYGKYVAKSDKARFPDGTIRTCVGTDTWDPAE